MTQQNVAFLTTPPGRLVWGSVSRPKTKDSQNRPLLIKTGPDAGKPTQKFEFGLAIPKGSERDWRETPWGQLVKAQAEKGFPNGQSLSPLFAWKIIDGDSQIPNQRGVKPCTREGWPGCWVLSFSSSFAPEVLDATGKNRIDPAQVKLGYVVQVAGSVTSNNNPDKPGVYLNHKFVSFQWQDKEIVNGPDPSTLGFGQHAAPQGASTQAQGAFIPPVQGAAYTPPSVSATPPPPPHPGILTPPAAGPVMTPKAAGKTYQDFLKAGWTHELLVAHGYLVA